MPPSDVGLDLVAYLTDPLLATLRSATGSAHTIHAVRTVAALDAALTQRPVAAALIDPLLTDRRDVGPLLPVLARHASVPIVVYTVVSAAAMHAYGILAAHGARHLMLYGIDDGPLEFAALFDTLPADALNTLLFRMIDPLLAGLPPSLARALTELFKAPHRVRDNNDVARAAGMSRRAYDRALERAGVASGDVLLRTARVARAYFYMRSTRLTLREIAAKMGYKTSRKLTSEVDLLTGFLPSSLRRKLEPDDFLNRVVVRLWRHGAPADIALSHAAHVDDVSIR